MMFVDSEGARIQREKILIQDVGPTEMRTQAVVQATSRTITRGMQSAPWTSMVGGTLEDTGPGPSRALA